MKNRFASLLINPRLRLAYCKLRWKLLKRKIKFHEQPTDGVGDNVVSYNLTAFDSDAAFGCGGRMNLVLYPLPALITEPKKAKVLIIGPRTEDDIFLAKALGFNDTRGLDLLTYSPHIDLGDMHDMPYGDEQFDAVILGWVVCYSSDPTKAFSESLRVLKKKGYLAIGWEWVPEQDKDNNLHILGNSLYELSDFKEAVQLPVVFENDPETQTNHHKSVIFKKAH